MTDSKTKQSERIKTKSSDSIVPYKQLNNVNQLFNCVHIDDAWLIICSFSRHLNVQAPPIEDENDQRLEEFLVEQGNTEVHAVAHSCCVLCNGVCRICRLHRNCAVAVYVTLVAAVCSSNLCRNYLPTDLRQPDLSYTSFRQSLWPVLFGQ